MDPYNLRTLGEMASENAIRFNYKLKMDSEGGENQTPKQGLPWV